MNKPPMQFSPQQAQMHTDQFRALAQSLNLSIFTILQLVIQFGSQAVPIIVDVANAFKGGFSWDKLLGVLKTDGPLVIAIAEAIAKALGVTLPTLPPMPA